jgi:DNA primase large subunit
MARILDHLRRFGTLTFKAEFELSLFLKGIGLEPDAQAQFWHDAKFSGMVNITIVYAKDYAPHCCATMVTRECPKTVSEVQGCPFRCVARSEMKKYLGRTGWNIEKHDIEEIAGQMPEHPQVACRMLFNAVFPNESLENEGVSHPVEFFVESEKRIKRALHAM